MSRARDIANLQSGGVINDASADLDFRIESNGNANMLFVDGGNDVLVIGQNAPDTTISGGKPAFQVIGSGFDGMAAITRRDSGVYGPALILSKSKSTTPDNYSIVANGDALGGITFIGDDGTNLDTYGATIQAVVDGTPGENDMPTRLVFSTTADGAASPTERMRITSSGDIGIGDSSPESNNNYKALTVSSTSGNGGGQVYVQSSSVSSVFGADATTDAKSILQTVTNHPLVLGTNNTGRMRIDTSGRVMIGTTDVGYSTHADLFTISRTANTSDHAGISIRSGTAGQSSIYFSDATGQVSGTYEASIWHDHANEVFSIYTQDYLRIYTGSLERMRITSSGNVGIGSSNSEEYPLFVKGDNITSGGGSATLCILDDGTSYNGTNPGGGVTFRGKYNNGGSTTNFATVQGIKENTTDGNYATALRFTTRANGGNLTEKMRIHSDGSVTIGKTAANNSAAGISMFGTTGMSVTRDGGVPFICHRRTNDGTLIQFRKDDGTVGYIAYQGAELQVGQGNASLQFSNSADAIVPANENGTANDDDIDLGISSGRFDNIFATNGTIQTSDENEKQDIASMTTAELAVGKRLSTLFKTFRWKSKVTKKADKARTHSGIVAQEVKEAFEAEGLDATKYALFCSDTWTNDDGDEQTRLGVRYPELLSFIASYNESRFTAIEARIAKLEGG